MWSICKTIVGKSRRIFLVSGGDDFSAGFAFYNQPQHTFLSNLAHFLTVIITLQRFSRDLRLRFHKRITKTKARHLLAHLARTFWLYRFSFIVLSVSSGSLFSQSDDSRLQISAQAGPVVFDELYGFHNTGRYVATGAMRVNGNLHALVRSGFIPASQYFSTPVGMKDAEVRLYELAIGAKLRASKFFSSRLRPFFSLTGGVLLYRPQSAVVPIGLVDVKIDPPDATKPLLSAAAGVDWKLTKTIALSLGFETSASRIAQRFNDGTSREKWRPFYSAAVGITGRIK